MEEINLRVEESEIFGLIGPDGAGKTTLFRILATLLVPDRGNAEVFGFDVVKDYREIRKRVGYMAGRFSLYHDLSVEENLNFYATVFGTTVKENYDLIKDIYSHIEPFKKRRAGALSGGMKQKLALSCALIHKPRVLILDEPTTGVDAVSRKEFWDMLHNIKDLGISVIVSTPYMDEALRCDRVGLMQKSKIMLIDIPENIHKNYPVPLYSVRAKNNYQLILSLRKMDWCKSAWLFGQEVHVGIKNSFSEINMDSEFQKMEGLESFKKINPGIEDTFIELMGKTEEL